ncbi:MAG: rhodanese-like domain-containing protein [Frankiaceae bacterium]
MLLDVREIDEWDAGHIHQARHLPLSKLPAAVAELPAGADILVICQAGRRSQTAAGMLAGSGRRAVNVEGGMSAWMRAGLPVVTRNGRPGRVV